MHLGHQEIALLLLMVHKLRTNSKGTIHKLHKRVNNQDVS